MARPWFPNEASCGHYDKEDGKVYYTRTYPEWIRGYDIPSIVPYSNHGGEAIEYHFRLRLNDLGKSILIVLNHIYEISKLDERGFSLWYSNLSMLWMAAQLLSRIGLRKSQIRGYSAGLWYRPRKLKVGTFTPKRERRSAELVQLDANFGNRRNKPPLSSLSVGVAAKICHLSAIFWTCPLC